MTIGRRSPRAERYTGKKREESTVALGATATYTHAFTDSSGFVVSITPEYGTNGNGDRDVVTLHAQLGIFGGRFLDAGQWMDFVGGLRIGPWPDTLLQRSAR